MRSLESDITDLHRVVGPDSAYACTVDIVGRPLHDATDELARRYRAQELHDFLRSEVRHSTGSYVLIDSGSRQAGHTYVVTGLAYPGGYFRRSEAGEVQLATSLANVLKGGCPLSVDDALVDYFFDKPSTNVPPLVTLFKGVSRLPPGCVLSIQHGRGAQVSARLWSYLQAAECEDSPPSLSAAMAEAVGNIRGGSSDIGVMLSGGVDSAALAMSLEEDGTAQLSFYSVRLPHGSPTNSPVRAEAMAAALGWDLSVVDFDRPANGDDYLEFFTSLMKRDFINPDNPHWAFKGTADGVDFPPLLVSGQNADAIATTSMRREPEPFFRAAGQGKPLEVWPRLIDTLLRNIQFTDPYLGSVVWRRNLSAFISLLGWMKLRTHRYRLDASADGVLLGFLTSGRPNLVSPRDLAAASSVIARSREIMDDGQVASSTRSRLDVLNWLEYIHNSSELLTKHRTLSGSAVLLPFMSGPLVSYFLARRRTVGDALSPKRLLYEYVERRLGKPYWVFLSEHELRRSSRVHEGDVVGVRSSLLEEHAELLSPPGSRLLDLVGDPAVQCSLARRYQDMNREIAGGAVKPERLRVMYRFLNVELLLAGV